MSLLLLFKATGSTTSSFTLFDTASISIDEGTFDGINLFLDETGNVSSDILTDEVLGQYSLFNQGETANIQVNEAIVASISGTFSKSLSDTASITITEAVVQFDEQVALTDTASVQINEAVANLTTETFAPLAETVNVAIQDDIIVDIGEPITINIGADDTASVRIIDVASVEIQQPQQVAQMTFTALTNNITFTTP